MTTSERLIASLKSVPSLLSLSPTTDWAYTFIPRLAHCFDRYAALVFTIFPSRISVPTEISSAFIFRFLYISEITFLFFIR